MHICFAYAYILVSQQAGRQIERQIERYIDGRQKDRQSIDRKIEFGQIIVLPMQCIHLIKSTGLKDINGLDKIDSQKKERQRVNR